MAGKLTEEQKAEIGRRYQAGESTWVLSKAYGVCVPVVCKYLDRAGIERRSQKRAMDQQAEQKAARLYQDGNSAVEIAGMFSVNASTIYKALRSQGVPRRDHSENACRQHGHDGCILVGEKLSWAVREYERGCSPQQIAKQLGLHPDTVRRTLKRSGVQLRSPDIANEYRMAIKPQDRSAVASEYSAGKSAARIARERGVSQTAVFNALHMQMPARSLSEANRNYHGLEIDAISAEQWRMLYWSVDSGYPSLRLLAQKFGVHWSSIKLRFDELGIKTRSMAEQAKIDFKYKRRPVPYYPGSSHNYHHLRAYTDSIRGTKLSKNRCQRMSEIQRSLHTRPNRPCWWCGELVERISYYLREPRWYCCRSHRSSGANWVRYRGADSVRPVILEKLKSLLQSDRYKSLPRNLETLEKAGSTIGATDAEYAEIMAEWAQG